MTLASQQKPVRGQRALVFGLSFVILTISIAGGPQLAISGVSSLFVMPNPDFNYVQTIFFGLPQAVVNQSFELSFDIPCKCCSTRL